MNTDLRKKAKHDSKKYFFKLMNNAVFRKNMENARKHRNMKLVTIEKRRNYLVSGPNYRTIKFLTENVLAIEMKKAKILMTNLVCLGVSILELSKLLMYEFLYNYVKQKYGEKAKLYGYRKSKIIWMQTIHKNK